MYPSLVIINIRLVCLINVYYIFSLSDLWQGGEEWIFKEKINARSLYNLYGHTLAQEPMTRVVENLQFWLTLLGRHYFIFFLNDLCSGVKKNILTEIVLLHYKTYNHFLAQEPLPPGVMEFTILIDPSSVINTICSTDTDYDQSKTILRGGYCVLSLFLSLPCLLFYGDVTIDNHAANLTGHRCGANPSIRPDRSVFVQRHFVRAGSQWSFGDLWSLHHGGSYYLQAT